MADDTNTAEREALGFFLEERGNTWVVQFKEGGCRPATIPEKALWLAFQAGRPPLAASAGSEPVAWFVEEHSDIQDLEWNRLKPTYPGNWKPLYTHPSPPEGMAGWLNAEDMAALERADECFEDGEGHDLPKSRMDRLIEIGVMRHNGGGYYSITTFGAFVLGDRRYHLPLETLDECSERLGREHRERTTAAPPLPASEAKEL
jgi:hypothetical protein